MGAKIGMSYSFLLDILKKHDDDIDIFQIDHFTVFFQVTWPLNGNEAGGDLVLIQTLLLFVV